jgi:hypothetical protein
MMSKSLVTMACTHPERGWKLLPDIMMSKSLVTMACTHPECGWKLLPDVESR